MTEITLNDCKSVFGFLTKAERKKITLAAISKIEARRRATLAVLMADPTELLYLIEEVYKFALAETLAVGQNGKPTRARVGRRLDTLSDLPAVLTDLPAVLTDLPAVDFESRPARARSLSKSKARRRAQNQNRKRATVSAETKGRKA